MKKLLLYLLAALVLVPGLRPAVRAATADEEQKLVGVLKSGASLADKDAACARLKLVGTPLCIPALAALLADEQLSHSARYALEPMPQAEAGQALLEALTKTKGLNKAGIIYSLGVRGEIGAVPQLAKCLNEPDAVVAAAAATALGQIGGARAVTTLEASASSSTGPLHTVAVDGLLRCANRFLSSNDLSNARSLFEQLYSSEKADGIRLAAYRGIILTSGPRSLELMIQGISGADGPAQLATLQLVPELKTPGLTEALAAVLPKAATVVQIALIEGLEQRGDTAALPALTALAPRVTPEVRVPLVKALGSLGDSSVASVLAEFAASGTPAEQRAARQALVDLRHGRVTETLVSLLETSKPGVQSELARALGGRDDKAAVPKLLELAQRGSVSAHKAALDALALLVNPEQVLSLVNLVVQAKDQAARSDAAAALNSACQRLQSASGGFAPEAFIRALQTGPTQTRVALLPLCSGLAHPQVRAALRSSLKDSDGEVRAAATHALCDSVDPELLDDVVNLAGSTREENIRSLAIRGAVRLATEEESAKRPINERLAAFKSLLTTADRPEQKRLVLAGLEELPDPEALKLVEPMLDEADVATEAARAVSKIAPMLAGKSARISEVVLKKALAATTDSATRKAVEIALQQIQARTDYLTDWQVSGPYRQNGKDYAALFDIVFAPETQAGDSVKWQLLEPGADAKRPGVMDLLKALGGEQCVAYARTWLRSDADEPAVLELGSDDGVKVWLNNKQVYALNIARPLQPGSDKINLQLRSGWNLLLLKITQDSQGWEFCARLRKPDGSNFAGLQCESSPPVGSK